jgi:transcription elongation factor GreA
VTTCYRRVAMAEESYPITPAGLDRMRAEVRRLKEVDRPENVRDIEVAREHGDLRENAEYHAAKDRQAQIDGRMKFLEYRIGLSEVIDPATITSNRVAFGATVTVRDLDTDEETVYAIVGEDEADADKGRLSIRSPLVRAMIGKSEGDSCTLHLPKGARELEVVRVEYKALT